MNDIRKVFADNFSRLMKERHLSQAKLASALNVDQTTISAWLRGESEPTLSKICMILELFDIAFEEIVEL